MLIKSSNFVKRQTRTSEFSYFDGSWEELENITTVLFNEGLFECGYREGVNLVIIPEYLLSKFKSAVVDITDDLEFVKEITKRREGEGTYLTDVAYGKKQEAKLVRVVLYKKEVLEEDPLNTDLTGADWEIISINASPTIDEVPMRPLTMARNQLADTPEGVGGTSGHYTSEQFAESIMFWNTHTLIREK